MCMNIQKALSVIVACAVMHTLATVWSRSSRRCEDKTDLENKSRRVEDKMDLEDRSRRG